MTSSVETKKTNPMMILSIVCVGIMYNANTGFVVLINSIVGDFFAQGISLSGAQISMILSLPTLLMIPGVIISGKLAQKISVRTIAVVSWTIFGLTSIALYFSVSSITAFLAVRALMGFGIGLCQPISRAIPSKLFDGNKRTKVIGYISMGGGILSVVMSIAFGQMAMTNWRNCLWAFPIMSIIFVVLALVFIPNIPPEQRSSSLGKGSEKQKLSPFGRPVIMICIAGFFIYMIGAVIQIKTSLHVAQTGIGGADFAGYISSASTFGIILGGFVFGAVYRKMGRWLLPVASILTALFYYLFAVTTSFVPMAIAGFAIGAISIGILMPYLMARVSFVAPPPRITMAITLVTLSCYIGQFLTTYYIELIEKMFNTTLIDVGTGSQPIASVVLYSVAIGYILIGAVGSIYIYATRNESVKTS